jgi:four helix bundle protein
MQARTHKDLIAWKKAVTLASRVYQTTASFPNPERHPLAGQMRRAALSVPSNIAEGAGRGSRAEYLRFLNISRGSLAELETQIHIALDLGLLSTADQIAEETTEVARLLSALVRSLKEYRERAASFTPTAHRSTTGARSTVT